MGKLSNAELLELWEQGCPATPVERALMLLSAYCPAESWETLSRISLGERDARLLKLRGETFGPRMQALCDCPHCGEQMEMSFLVADMLIESPGDPEASLDLTVDGYDVHFRLPNSRDLTAVSAVGDGSLAARQLLSRCLIDVRRQNETVPPDRLASAILDAVANRIAEADIQSNIELEITCRACQNSWVSFFDIAAFFWTEISILAQRCLHDVHVLASAYGWSEESILALSAARRQAYIEMADG